MDLARRKTGPSFTVLVVYSTRAGFSSKTDASCRCYGRRAVAISEADWTVLNNSLSTAQVARGVTAGVTVPNGGGVFAFGCNSRAVVSGAVGLKVNQANFNPFEDDSANPTGGSVRAAIKRGVSAGTTGFAPMLFINLQGGPVGSVNDQGYLLGLSDNDPHEIVLRKGAPAGGLSPTDASILRRSTGTFIPDTWHHLRLDAIFNPNGDVVLKVFYNDLGSNAVTAPVWTPVVGMDDFIDDALGVNSGSLPFSGGFAGMAFQCSDVDRRGYWDHFQALREK
jgi:hypothetical protein